MNDRTVIAHVGLHKTGSTTLQRDVFPSVPGVSLTRGFESLRSLLPAGDVPPAAVHLISDESIAGTPGWGRELCSFRVFTNRVGTFHQLFSPSKYIIAFRRHSTWIRSMYCQFLHEGGTDRLSEFYSQDDESQLRLGDSPWKQRYLFLAGLVGQDDVFVYMQEDLLQSPETVVPKLVEFITNRCDPEIRAVSDRLSRFPGPLLRNASGNLEGYPTLRRLNLVTGKLRRWRFPRFCRRWLERCELTPRQLCQHSRLPRIWGAEMNLDEAAIDAQYHDDLTYATDMSRISYQRQFRSTSQRSRRAAG